MRLADLFGPFLDTLRTQRTRTVLTVMGITWGTVAVVVLLAFGVGLERQMKKNAHGMGQGIVILFPGTTTRSFQGFPDGRDVRLSEADVALLRREVPEIEVATFEYGSRGVPVRLGPAAATPYITGVEPEYEELRHVFPDSGGRFINALDVQGRRRVVFLGDEIKRLLFGDADALGKEVSIGATPFTVVGVLRPKTQNSSYGGGRDEGRVFIPASTYQAMFGDRHVARIIFRPGGPQVAEAAQEKARAVLGHRHTFDPEDRDAVGMWDTGEADKFWNALFLGFNLFLGVVGSFTLVVGGIGVANIMYIVVRERTREIGIRRALGARARDVLGQVLLEAVLIVGVGATLGVMVSVALVRVAGMLPIEEQVGIPTISPAVLGVTLGLLALVALLAGWFPARRAASLDPVECLRY